MHEDGTQIVGMSPNAHYLVTVSPWVEQKLQLFMWTLGKTEPEGNVTKSFKFILTFNNVWLN